MVVRSMVTMSIDFSGRDCKIGRRKSLVWSLLVCMKEKMNDKCLLGRSVLCSFESEGEMGITTLK